MVDDRREPGDEPPHPPMDSFDSAALREQATAVLAGYHDIELSEAAELLLVLADHLGCPVDELAIALLRRSAVRREVDDEPPAAEGGRAAE